MKILFVGGGTGGPNAPIVAVAEYIKKVRPETRFIFVSDGNDLAKKMFAGFNSPHYPIPAGKWRRYFSFQNFLDIFKIIAGIIVSLFLIFKNKPNVIFSAGSFVSLPVGIAGRMLNIPLIIHQQDVTAARTNAILAGFASKITLSLAESEKQFPTDYKNKIITTGNPTRKSVSQGNVESGRSIFKLDAKLPTILILGGGTGAKAINDVVAKNLGNLTNLANIIHLTGSGKAVDTANNPRYHQFEYLDRDLPHAYAISDLVVSRAGFNVISELSALNKPAVLIPLPNSPQVTNALYLSKKNAAMVIKQEELGEKLLPAIEELMQNNAIMKQLEKNIGRVIDKDATKKVADVILSSLSSRGVNS